MMQQTRLQSVLSLLDDGLALYRRHFSAFLLVGAIWLVPLAIVLVGAFIGASWLDETGATLLAFGVAAACLPAIAYGFTVLSRAAHDVAGGQSIQLGRVLRVGPLRLIGMLAFALVYFVLIYIVTTVVSLVCICPAYLVGILSVAAVVGIGGDSSVAELLGMIAVALVFGTAYLLVLAFSGASISSLVYALQPWAADRAGFGVSVQRSFELITYRFFRNILAWIAASIVSSGAGLAVALIVGLIVPLPAFMYLGESSRLAAAISGAAWLLSLALILPPLPIWMALLYRRNTVARAATDLEQRVIEWRQAMSQ